MKAFSFLLFLFPPNKDYLLLSYPFRRARLLSKSIDSRKQGLLLFCGFWSIWVPGIPRVFHRESWRIIKPCLLILFPHPINERPCLPRPGITFVGLFYTLWEDSPSLSALPLKAFFLFVSLSSPQRSSRAELRFAPALVVADETRLFFPSRCDWLLGSIHFLSRALIKGSWSQARRSSSRVFLPRTFYWSSYFITSN